MSSFKFIRQEYIDVANPAEAIKLGYELVQIKYDGIWARVTVRHEIASVYSRNDQLKATFATTLPDCVLIGEFMYGSEWAKKDGREGQIYVFDVESIDYERYEDKNYLERYQALVSLSLHFSGTPFRLVGTSRIEHAHNAWCRIESGENDYEGLVYRKTSDLPTAKLARSKKEVTDDVVIMDKYEGQNRLSGSLGGLVVGKFNSDGILTPLYRVGGGFDDALRDEIWREWPKHYLKVIECKGKARFESGALRHPNFSKFRPDKQPSECRIT